MVHHCMLGTYHTVFPWTALVSVDQYLDTWTQIQECSLSHDKYQPNNELIYYNVINMFLFELICSIVQHKLFYYRMFRM